MQVAKLIRHTRDSRTLWSVLAFAWLLSIAAGLAAMARFDWTPGGAGAAPALWPAACAIERAADRPTLVVAIHPRCPCSRSSLAQVAALAERHAAECRIIVLMLTPAADDRAWTDAPAWRAARDIQGVEVIADARGRLSAAFGAQTSGHADLFDRDGRLLYRGGLTLSRAHESAGPGLAAVEALLHGGEAVHAAPVFGCALFGPDDLCGPKDGDDRCPR